MTEHRAGAPIRAMRDDAMTARVVRRVPLMYAAGADALTDRPAHVRASSGMAWIGDRLAVVQDDANFVALVDTDNGQCEVVVLPTGHGGRRQFDDGLGNKRYKHDFEALVAVGDNPTRLMAFGSGSSSTRENILVVRDATTSLLDVRVVSVPQFYAGLRACVAFAGRELNVEGAALVGENIRLFNRGNGAASKTQVPVNATCDINVAALLFHLEHPTQARPPLPQNTAQYLLGEIDGVRLSFTDAVAVGDAVVYVAAAEDSPDSIRDGAVFGSAIGMIHTRYGCPVARWTPLTFNDGDIARVKVEGVAMRLSAAQVFVVVDSDDPDQPSELLELELFGFNLG